MTDDWRFEGLRKRKGRSELEACKPAEGMV